MPVSRIDLADAGSPEKLVTLILRAEPDLAPPIRIERLCQQLDIIDVRPLATEGFEGGLVTDTERSNGIILLNEGSHPYRRRFTMGHELAHFLIPTHMPDQPGRFLCSREDMSRLTANENDRRARMEVEANRFSSLLLIPPPMLRAAIGRRAPDLQHIVQLAGQFKVSKEAMARAYVQCHDELVAVVLVHNGKVMRAHRDRVRFPFIQPSTGEAVPQGSVYCRGKQLPLNVASEFGACVPDNWIEVKRGERAPTLHEQVYLQRDGYVMILLHLMNPDEDEEEERDLERSWQPRFRR